MSKKKENQEEVVPPHLAYAGVEQSYWDNLQIAFREILGAEVHSFKYSNYIEKEVKKIQKISVKVVADKPKVVFVDFSNQKEAFLFLSKTLKRQNLEGGLTIIGILPSGAENTDVERAILNGCDFVYVKDLDYHSVVYGASCLLMGDDFKGLERVSVRVKQDSILRKLIRINYVTEKGLRIESDWGGALGEKVQLETNFDPKIFPPFVFKIESKEDKEIFYDCKSAFNATFLWEDPAIGDMVIERNEFLKDCKLGFPPKGKPTEEEINAKKGQVEIINERMPKLIGSYQKWIKKEGVDFSDAKRVRVLTIDRLGRIFDQIDRVMHEYPFSLRWQSLMIGFKELLSSSRPQILTFLLEPKSDPIEVEEEIPAKERTEGGPTTRKKFLPGPPRNDLERLAKLFSEVKSIQSYTPFIVIFNCSKGQSNEIKSKAGYPQALYHEGDFSLQTLLSLSAILDKKIVDEEKSKFDEALNLENSKRKAKLDEKGGGLFTPAKPSDVIPLKKYFKKNSPESWGYLLEKFEFSIISENDIFFKSSQKFDPGTILQIIHPAQFFITVMEPQKSQASEASSQGLQRGVIHGMSLIEKEKLKKFVSAVYLKHFADKQAS